jgi:RimJ/RimL family protein N-acetyltransferase
MTELAISLEPWDESGLALLRAMNTHEQMIHLGGPEPDEKLLERQARYLTYDTPGEVRMLRVVRAGVNVGSIGYWETEWGGETAYETGWCVVPGYHGQGIGGMAASLLLDVLRGEARHRFLYAFPLPGNGGSNGICRRLGFELTGVADFEYPKGTISPHNVWRLDLSARSQRPA